MSLRQDCAKLKSQVVESPEKLLKVHHNRYHSLQSRNATLQHYDNSVLVCKLILLRQMIEDMKVSTVTERENIVAIESRTVELQNRLQSLHKIEKEMQKGLKTLEEAEMQLSKHKQTRAKLKAHQQKLTQSQNVLQEVNINIQVCIVSLCSASDLLNIGRFSCDTTVQKNYLVTCLLTSIFAAHTTTLA